MANQSPAVVVKQVEGEVSMILRKVNQDKIGEKAREALAKLRQALIDAKVYTRDYELSEMREEQVDNAKKARKYLEQARQSILRASEFNVFGPVDVAHLTSKLEQVIGDLK